jgi:hypothetical protein
MDAERIRHHDQEVLRFVRAQVSRRLWQSQVHADGEAYPRMLRLQWMGDMFAAGNAGR